MRPLEITALGPSTKVLPGKRTPMTSLLGQRNCGISRSWAKRLARLAAEGPSSNFSPIMCAIGDAQSETWTMDGQLALLYVPFRLFLIAGSPKTKRPVVQALPGMAPLF